MSRNRSVTVFRVHRGHVDVAPDSNREPYTDTCPVCWQDGLLTHDNQHGWACHTCKLDYARADLVANARRVAVWRMLARRQARRGERPAIGICAIDCEPPFRTGCSRRSNRSPGMIPIVRLDRFL